MVPFLNTAGRCSVGCGAEGGGPLFLPSFSPARSPPLLPLPLPGWRRTGPYPPSIYLSRMSCRYRRSLGWRLDRRTEDGVFTSLVPVSCLWNSLFPPSLLVQTRIVTHLPKLVPDSHPTPERKKKEAQTKNRLVHSFGARNSLALLSSFTYPRSYIRFRFLFLSRYQQRWFLTLLLGRF